MTYTEAVKLAKEGSESGFRYLYESTYSQKYYLSLKYMKNQENAEDVLQEAYIKAFSSLNTLSNPESFPSWLGMTVANTAKNALKKRTPILFTDMSEEGEIQDFQVEDGAISGQPEMAYSQKETTELVRELIDSLSAEQRMCIVMFYLDEQSISQIAQALDCSENTVKSRLNYGRKNIKKKAEELQSRGCKLYSMAPLPFLLWLMRSEMTALACSGACVEAGAAIEKAVLAAAPITRPTANLSAKTAKAAAKTAGRAAGKGIAAKVIAAVLVVAAIGGTATAYGMKMFCFSHTWQEATCTEARTCTRCGKVEGEALGHAWEAATCEDPETCSRCGATQGQALGHSWEAATCETPETCTTCGATRGEALGHTWRDADYQLPKTCTTCGITEGEPLEAAFLSSGCTINVTSMDTPYEYVSCCSLDRSINTVGRVYFYYSVMDGDESHEALEGYEWVTVTIKACFEDENAQNYAAVFAWFFTDYYEMNPLDSNSDGTGYITYNGVKYPECLYQAGDTVWGGWQLKDDGSGQYEEWAEVSISARLPKDYDGLIVGVRNPFITWSDGQTVADVADENTLFMRVYM